MQEFPELQKKVYEKFDKDKLIVLAIGRGHSIEDLKIWNEKKSYTLPIAADKDKKIYELYFSRYIPRTVLIDKNGKIVKQKVGYTPDDLQALISIIEKKIN